MTLSRKEFLKQGVFSLGKMLLPPQEPGQRSEAPPLIRPPGFTPEKVDEGGQPKRGHARTAGGCIASGGCFTCSERCPEGAIEIAWGSGIRIDQDRCTGCGVCENCCPVRPAAIRVDTLNTGS